MSVSLDRFSWSTGDLRWFISICWSFWPKSEIWVSGDMGGLLKMVGLPNNHGVFLLKMIILGCEMGETHHLRKHPIWDPEPSVAMIWCIKTWGSSCRYLKIIATHWSRKIIRGDPLWTIPVLRLWLKWNTFFSNVQSYIYFIKHHFTAIIIKKNQH